MLDISYFVPISDAVLAKCALQSKGTIGNNISKYTSKDEFPDITKSEIVIFGIRENRGDENYQNESLDFSSVRDAFYSLFKGNWSKSMVDLGDIQSGNTIEDTYFAVKEVMSFLLKENKTVLLLGGSQDLLYPIYRSFDAQQKMIDIVNIDRSFDFGNVNEELSNKSYLSKIVIEEPNNLKSYTNLGYQTFFNSQEEIDLIEKLFFEAKRLGLLSKNIQIAEPYIRDASIVSIDLNVIKYQDLGIGKYASPNGLTSEQICALSRYAGLSSTMRVFGIFEYTSFRNTDLSSMSIAQVLWYAIEGINFRQLDFPEDQSNYQKFTVLVEDQEVIFYKSLNTSRWWVELPISSLKSNKPNKLTLLSCSEEDYMIACNNELPSLYFKALQRSIL